MRRFPRFQYARAASGRGSGDRLVGEPAPSRPEGSLSRPESKEPGIVRPLHAATPDDIRQGRVADADALRTLGVLEARGEDPSVVAEVRAPSFPPGWSWIILAGVEEALAVLEERDLDVLALPEGSAFYPEEPVLQVVGKYRSFADLQSPVLGMLATATGTATAAARLKLAADGRRIYAVDLRGVHPAVGPVIERAAFIGGCDAVTTPKGADLTGADPLAAAGQDLALILGEAAAWSALADSGRSRPADVAVGSTGDERAAAVAAAEALGDKLASVRLDVGGSSPQALVRAVREVRWELDGRGHSRVRLVVVGDLDDDAVRAVARLVDGFAVGERLAAAPAAPLEFDIVEVDGRPVAPRGTLSGRKALWRCQRCGNRGIAPSRARPESCPRCAGRLESLLTAAIRWGRRERPPEDAGAIRERALREAAEAQRAAG